MQALHIDALLDEAQGAQHLGEHVPMKRFKMEERKLEIKAAFESMVKFGIDEFYKLAEHPALLLGLKCMVELLSINDSK